MKGSKPLTAEEGTNVDKARENSSYNRVLICTLDEMTDHHDLITDEVVNVG